RIRQFSQGVVLCHRSRPLLTGRLEQWNGNVVRELGIDDFHGHIALDNFGIWLHIDQIGQHAWPFLEFDHGEDIGRCDLHGAIERAMQNLKRVELALTAGLHPGEVMGVAVRTEHPRVEVDLTAVLAFREHEFAFLHAIPVGFRLWRNRLWNWTIDFHRTPFMRTALTTVTSRATRRYRVPNTIATDSRRGH